MGKRGKHERVAGDRRVLQADEALEDIHTSPPILRSTSGVVGSYPAVAPLHRIYLADTVPHPVASQDDQDNLAQRESEAAVGEALVAVAGVGGLVVAVEVVVVVAAADGLRRTVWYAMLPPVGQYQ